MSDGANGFLWGIMIASLVWLFVAMRWEARTRRFYQGLIEDYQGHIEEYRAMLPHNRERSRMIAIAAGTQSAETSETSAPSEGCQSGGESRIARKASPETPHGIR